MKPSNLPGNVATGVAAGLLAWFGVYTFEFAWSLAAHPASWLRAYLEGPLPSVFALYGAAGLVTGLAAAPFLGRRPDGALPAIGRAAAGIGAGYLALWAVIRNAWPDEMDWGRLSIALVALVLTGLLVRLARRIVGRPLTVLAASIVALFVLGTLGAHGFLNPGASVRDARGSAPPGAPNVVLLTIDTLRARNLGSYGYERARTPNLDRLAAEGTRWTWFYTPVPQTAPSFATILTGLHPMKHGVILNGWRLGKSVETLPERLRAAGWRTMGFVSVSHLGSPFGFDQGFDYFGNQNPIFNALYLYSSSTGSRFSLVDLITEESLGILEGSRWRAAARTRPGDRTIDEVLRLLDQDGDTRPFFLWVHLFDPHLPFEPPERLRAIFRDAPLTLPPSPHSPEVLRERFDGYDGEVAFVDEQVGRLVDALGERLERTLLVFTADHGEALGEHGYTGHSNHLSEEILQVPFFIRWPGKVEAGRVVSERGTTLDVTPTILDALGLPEAAGADGASVLGRPRAAPPLFLMTDNPGGRQIRGVLSGRRKLLLSSERGFAASGWGDAERELYDLARDPGEAQNLAGGGNNRGLSSLHEATETYFESGAFTPQRIDAATRRALGALGYVQ